MSLAPLEFVRPGPNGEAGSFLLRQRSSSCFAIENLYGLWSHHLVCGEEWRKISGRDLIMRGERFCDEQLDRNGLAFSTLSGQEVKGVLSGVFQPRVYAPTGSVSEACSRSCVPRVS